MAASMVQYADNCVLCCQDFGVDQQTGEWRQHRNENIGKLLLSSRRESQLLGGMITNL
jgi:hypothetical protein